MALFGFLKGKKAFDIQTSAGVVVTSIAPLTDENHSVVGRLLGKAGTVAVNDSDVLTLKATKVTGPFIRAKAPNGDSFKPEGDDVRVSLWFREAADGGQPMAEDMVLLREARNGDVFSVTHVIHGERAYFAATIIPPCCEGDSVLVRYAQDGKDAQRVVQSPRALELGVAKFFNESVRFAVASTPQIKSILVETHRHIAAIDHNCGEGFQYPAGYR
jgi:hypothetical protein